MPLQTAAIKTEPTRPVHMSRSASYLLTGVPSPPVTTPSLPENGTKDATDAVLELTDGTACRGFSFGAEAKSIAGECVFQTGTCKLILPMHASDLGQGWSVTPSP
jgi:hypothetical protein